MLRADAPTVILATLLGGCAPEPIGTGMGALDPDDRARAIAGASVRRADRETLEDLVEQLDSDDALVRMTAITALKRLTGHDMGFAPFDPSPARTRAIERWVDAVASGQVTAEGAADDG